MKRFCFEPIDLVGLVFTVLILASLACGRKQASPPPVKPGEASPSPIVAQKQEKLVQSVGGENIPSLAPAGSEKSGERRLGLFSSSVPVPSCAKEVQNPAPSEPTVIKWSATSCRDGDYCCGPAKGDHCFGGNPPYCDRTMVGPDVTANPCNPYELGRVKVTGFLIEGRKLTIYLQSDCPPNWVEVRDYLHVKPIEPLGYGAVATWYPEGKTSGSLTLEAPEAGRPKMFYVAWPSGGTTQIYSGQIARAGEAIKNRLDLAWKSRGAMNGPFKDYR